MLTECFFLHLPFLCGNESFVLLRFDAGIRNLKPIRFSGPFSRPSNAQKWHNAPDGFVWASKTKVRSVCSLAFHSPIWAQTFDGYQNYTSPPLFSEKVTSARVTSHEPLFITMQLQVSTLWRRIRAFVVGFAMFLCHIPNVLHVGLGIIQN